MDFNLKGNIPQVTKPNTQNT